MNAQLNLVSQKHDRQEEICHSHRPMTHMHVLIIIQELVIDVVVVTSTRHAERSCSSRFAVAKPRFTGRWSFSMVLSQDCLGRPILRLQSPGGPRMQAWRARWWSYQGSTRLRWSKKERWRLLTVSDRTGCSERERILSLVTKSRQTYIHDEILQVNY